MSNAFNLGCLRDVALYDGNVGRIAPDTQMVLRLSVFADSFTDNVLCVQALQDFAVADAYVRRDTEMCEVLKDARVLADIVTARYGFAVDTEELVLTNGVMT